MVLLYAGMFGKGRHYYTKTFYNHTPNMFLKFECTFKFDMAQGQQDLSFRMAFAFAFPSFVNDLCRYPGFLND
jgi:hypothetical protein